MRPQAAAGVTRPVRLDSTLSEVQRPDGTGSHNVLLSAAESAESRLSRRLRDMSCSPHTNEHPAREHTPGKTRAHSGLQPAQRVQGGPALGDRRQQQLAHFGLVGLPVELREDSVLST